jgi:flagellin-like hook-associated protein FlgL
MRVTFSAIYSGIESVNDAAERFVRAHRQVESGKRVQVGSDDPGAALRIVNGHAEIGTLDSYTRASDGAASRLAVMDTMLTDIVDKITEAKVAVSSVRGTTAGQNARDAAAERLRGLRDSLADDINTSFRGRYLFSGAEVQTQSYALVAGVWTYQGDTQAVTIDIGENRNVRTTLDGQAIFQGSDPTDLLTTLDDLAVAAETNDQAALDAGLATLQRAFDRATRAQSQIGADQRGVEEELERLRSFKLVSATAVSKDEDADLVAAISELTKADQAYRAALGAIGTTQRISLLDYLR